jgi:DNA-binding transcriptional LysR family regulator
MESRLLGWRPSAGGLDRDRMLFDAGRASARSSGRVGPWHSATVLLALLSTGLGLALLDATADRRDLRQALLARQIPVEPIPDPGPIPTAPDVAPEPTPPGPIADPRPPDPSSYLALTRRLVSGDGLDGPEALPDPGIDPDSVPNGPVLRAGGFGRPLGL